MVNLSRNWPYRDHVVHAPITVLAWADRCPPTQLLGQTCLMTENQMVGKLSQLRFGVRFLEQYIVYDKNVR